MGSHMLYNWVWFWRSDPLASTFWVLESKACTTLPSFVCCWWLNSSRDMHSTHWATTPGPAMLSFKWEVVNHNHDFCNLLYLPSLPLLFATCFAVCGWWSPLQLLACCAHSCSSWQCLAYVKQNLLPDKIICFCSSIPLFSALLLLYFFSPAKCGSV